MSTKPSTAQNLYPTSPPAPARRQGLDARATVASLHLAAGRLIARLTTLRAELERAPLRDADPERDEGSVSRVVLLEHALDTAEVAATSVRVALGVAAHSRRSIERVQVEAAGAEAMLVLLGREIDRAPWDASDGRLELLGELAGCATAAARLVRAGLGDLAARVR